MLATLLVHLPLTIVPLLQPPIPECQLDVMTPMAIEERTLADFNSRIGVYLVLHRRIARALPPFEMFDEEDPFFADELRQALVAARPDARAGAFFTPPIADVLRQRIDLMLAHNGASALPIPQDLLLIDRMRLTVNEPFPDVPNPFVGTPLMAALPPLPPELTFAIWGRDVALVDVTANLVLDVLTDAVPAWPGTDVIYR